MQNYVIQQWASSVEASTAFLKQFSEINTASMNQVADNGLAMTDLAGLGKSVMGFWTQVRKSNQDMLNSLIQLQLAPTDEKVLADATRNSAAIWTDATKRLVESQMELVNVYMEASASYLEGLKSTRTTNDFAAVTMHTLTEIQAKSRDKTLETMAVLSGIQTALEDWTETTLDSMSTQSDNGSIVPSIAAAIDLT